MADLRGGFSAAKPKDDIIDAVIKEIQHAPELDAIKDIEVISYQSQVVAGTNYIIKLKHSTGHSEVKVFKPLPHTGKPATVLSIKAIPSEDVPNTTASAGSSRPSALVDNITKKGKKCLLLCSCLVGMTNTSYALFVS